MSSDKVKCDYCENEFAKRGLTNHKNKCPKKPVDDSTDTISSNVNTSNNIVPKVIEKKT